MGFWNKFKEKREAKKQAKEEQILQEEILEEQESEELGEPEEITSEELSDFTTDLIVEEDKNDNLAINEEKDYELSEDEELIIVDDSVDNFQETKSESNQKEELDIEIKEVIINDPLEEETNIFESEKDENKNQDSEKNITIKNFDGIIEEEVKKEKNEKTNKVEIEQVKKSEKQIKLEEKLEEKRLKKIKKQREKQVKAEKAMVKSALNFSKDIKKLSKKYKEADDEFFEELEEILIKTDMGMKMVLTISNNLQKKVKTNTSFQEIKELLVEQISDLYDVKKKDGLINYQDGRLNIFMIVGVNGTGKTTSIAKLAAFYAAQGKKVLIAAGDTFRAGAVEQLDEWVKTRLKNIDLFKGAKKNQDPSSVIFDAIKLANEENYDLLLIDTAGRLQNKVNLMAELEKMHSIVHKFDKHAPHEVMLVIDATTGQNGVIQAKSFSEVTKVSGIILTKMDGTSKGGIALAIKDELNIPVKLVGIGEQIDDLVEFEVEDYVYGLVSGFMEESEEEE